MSNKILVTNLYLISVFYHYCVQIFSIKIEIQGKLLKSRNQKITIIGHFDYFCSFKQNSCYKFILNISILSLLCSNIFYQNNLNSLLKNDSHIRYRIDSTTCNLTNNYISVAMRSNFLTYIYI